VGLEKQAPFLNSEQRFQEKDRAGMEVGPGQYDDVLNVAILFVCH